MPSVIFTPAYRTYSFGEEHPFGPVRVDMTLDLIGALGHTVESISPEPATTEDLLTAHDEAYVRCVEEMSAGRRAPGAPSYGLGTQDTPAFSGMDEAARWLVGGTLYGARLIAEGKAKRVLQLGGGLHHAGRSSASGFCIYNDLAVAINALTGRGLRTAYIDIDVHHGNGVQEILNEDPGVLTVSLHESGQYLFPGSGEVRELGSGAGRGLKLNVPLQPFTAGDSYREVFDQVIPPALRHFRPDVLVVQAGADAHYDDPLADLMLTTDDYAVLFRQILEWADLFASGRVLLTLGGGYSPGAAPRIWALLYLLLHDLPIVSEIPEAWRDKWQSALGEKLPRSFHDPKQAPSGNPNGYEIAHRNRQVAERLLDLARQYWS